MAAGAAFGLVRVIATLLNEPRASGDAQRPFGVVGFLSPPALPAPGAPTPSVAAGSQPEGTPENIPARGSGSELADVRLSAAEVPHAAGPAATGIATQPVEQPESTAGQTEAGFGLTPPTSGALTAGAVGKDVAVSSPSRSAAGLGAGQSQVESGGAAPAASAAATAQLAVPTARTAPPAQPGPEQPAAPQPGTESAPPPAVPVSPQVAALPQPLALAPQTELQAAEGPVAIPAEPSRLQPPPPALLLLVSADASAEEVEAAALGTFRELYPIFEPFQACLVRPLADHISVQTSPIFALA